MRIALGLLSSGPEGLVVDSGAGNQDFTIRAENYWCGTWLGQNLSPDTCRVKTPAEIRAEQAAKLRRTSMTPENIAAAIAAGDQAVIDDAASHPQDYEEQIAAANHPYIASVFGEGFAASLFPVDVSDPNHPTSKFPWLAIALGVGSLALLYAYISSRH